MRTRIRHLLRGVSLIATAFIVLYSLGAAYDCWTHGAEWSIAAYHRRFGYLLLFGGWITIVLFLFSDFVRPRNGQGRGHY